jgi:tetratricopeptide (TPR) repeat protein
MVSVPLLSMLLLFAAGPEERARELFEAGVEAARQERWEAALDAFERSKALLPRPSTEFNIGSTLLKLGRAGDAIRSLSAYLEMSDPSADRALRVEATRLLREAEALAKPEALEPPPPPPPPPDPPPASIVPPPPPPPIEVESDSFVTHPLFIASIAVVVAGAAVGIGFAVGSGERDPDPGSAGVVLKALVPRE